VGARSGSSRARTPDNAEQQILINFDRPAEPIIPRRPPSIAAKFRRFVAANPRLVTAIENLARARQRSGQASWSMRACFEILREQVDVAGHETVDGGHRVKINNSYTRLMTDLVEARCPDLRGFFRTR
jgi:hypothetical protein